MNQRFLSIPHLSQSSVVTCPNTFIDKVQNYHYFGILEKNNENYNAKHLNSVFVVFSIKKYNKDKQWSHCLIHVLQQMRNLDSIQIKGSSVTFKTTQQKNQDTFKGFQFEKKEIV